MGWKKRRSWRDDDYYYRYPKTSPIPVTGGIKAQSQRGGFGKSWWARRWIAVLEGFHIGARLSRGRSYARHGQVLSIEIENGLVKAKVQGSRSKPYDIIIKINTLVTEQWKRLAEAISQEAIFAARLLAGEIPENIEDIFNKIGISLFPARLTDIQTQCSCPDWSNPCKHLAAVFYIIGEEFDRDPFLIFKLRGKGREEFMELLGALQQQKDFAPEEEEVPLPEKSCRPEEKFILPVNPEAFWATSLNRPGEAGQTAMGFSAERPAISAALPKYLGNFPFWKGYVSFLPALEKIYDEASLLGESIWNGTKTEFLLAQQSQPDCITPLKRPPRK
ncbi:MAG TPA: SWIM zinc finger family protein [Candidatus Sumerlaeota bacterium]|nr:SWIM zinc finger family protein [Candidatus Sumerlaeota bacterium]